MSEPILGSTGIKGPRRPNIPSLDGNYCVSYLATPKKTGGHQKPDTQLNVYLINFCSSHEKMNSTNTGIWFCSLLCPRHREEGLPVNRYSVDIFKKWDLGFPWGKGNLIQVLYVKTAKRAFRPLHVYHPGKSGWSAPGGIWVVGVQSDSQERGQA